MKFFLGAGALEAIFFAVVFLALTLVGLRLVDFLNGRFGMVTPPASGHQRPSDSSEITRPKSSALVLTLTTPNETSLVEAKII